MFKPKREWQTISTEATTIPELYKSYVVILAAIGPVASIIGRSLVGISIPFVGSMRVPVIASILSAVASYVMTLVGIYVLALVIDILAPSFSGEKNLNQAFKLACYSCTPSWVLGVVEIVPSLSPLMILSIYEIYLYYLGIPILMKSPREKSLGYTIAVIIAVIPIFFMIGFISGIFISYPIPGLLIR